MHRQNTAISILYLLDFFLQEKIGCDNHLHIYMYLFLYKKMKDCIINLDVYIYVSILPAIPTPRPPDPPTLLIRAYLRGAGVGVYRVEVDKVDLPRFYMYYFFVTNIRTTFDLYYRYSLHCYLCIKKVHFTSRTKIWSAFLVDKVASVYFLLQNVLGSRAWSYDGACLCKLLLPGAWEKIMCVAVTWCLGIYRIRCCAYKIPLY